MPKGHAAPKRAILVNADGTVTEQAFLGADSIVSYDLKRKWQGFEIAHVGNIEEGVVVYYEVPADG